MESGESIYNQDDATGFMLSGRGKVVLTFRVSIAIETITRSVMTTSMTWEFRAGPAFQRWARPESPVPKRP